MYLEILICLAVALQFTESQNGDFIDRGCNGEADVIFLVDTSSSVSDQEFTNSKDFIRRLVSRLDINFNKTRVAFATTEVGNYAKVHFFYFGDKGLLLNAIDKANRTSGVSMSLPNALRYTRNVMLTLQNGARNSIPDVLFIIAPDAIITEFDETDSSLKQELAISKNSDIFVGMVLYGTTVSSDAKRLRANGLVSAPFEDNLIFVSDSGSLLLNSIVAMVQIRLCLEIPACAGLADITFVLDRTGSIGIDNWYTELDFVANVVKNMYIRADGIQIAVIVYGTESTLWFPLNRHRSKRTVLEAVSKIQYDEATETRTDLALAMVQEVFGIGYGNRISVRDIAIVVTDGSSTDSVKTRNEAQNSKDRGIRTFSIGVKNDFDENFQQELDELGSTPKNDHVFQVSRFSNLESIEDTLVRRTCREAPPNCTKEIDVVFAIDASGSISREDFLRIINFVRDLVSRLGVESGAARVGVMSFSGTPELQFHLNSFNKVSDMTRNISGIKYIQGSTMTADALYFVQNTMFTEENGDRPGVDNVLLVITDGESNNGTATVETARKVRDNGTAILSLGVGAWVIDYELEGMASHPKVRNMFHVDDYETLFTATDLLIATICDVIDDCESNPCHNGGRCIDSMNQYYCKCATGFTGRDCDKSCVHKADIVFVLDSSGSIQRENYFVMQSFVQDIIHGVDVDGGARIGMVTYSTNARVEFYLSEHNTTQTVLNAMNLRYTGGTTNTADALRLVRDRMFIASNGNRADRIDVAILLTDGKSDNRERTLQEAVEVRKAGIHLSVIGVGSSIRPAELKGIATDPDDKNVYTVKDFNALTGIIETLLNDVCNENNECNPNPCENGGSCRDGIGMYTCRCAPGFTGVNCERACDNDMDIGIMLDVSGSIQQENFQYAVDFMKELVNQLDIDSGKVRISLITFNNTARVVFPLDQYNNKEDVKLEMDKLRFYGGRTNTADALRKLSLQVFRAAAGDRRLAHNFGVLITDGLPNVEVNKTGPEAISARIEGTHLILATIGQGLTTGRNSILLQGIPSSPTAANFFNVPKYREMIRMVPDIANAMCNDVDECLSTPCKNGGICEDGIKKYVCKCRDTFTGLNCDRKCSPFRDVVLVVDTSGSIEENNNFDLEMTFVRNLIHGFDFHNQKTHVAYVTFSRFPRTHFYLNNYTSTFAQLDILNAISIDDFGRETDIAAAIFEAHNNVFRPNLGDRSGVKNIMIIVSDGRNTVVNDQETFKQADTAKRLDIDVYTVSVGENPHRSLMSRVASSPTSTYFYTLPSISDIPETTGRILENICL